MLSFARHVCLIKFVISALSLFYLSLLKAPKSICAQITEIQTKFLWGGEQRIKSLLGLSRRVSVNLEKRVA